ncbi:addiction module antidote protein [Pseudomonas sp. Irchel s3f19]|uniref:addiction module antidote protein n=1 Tax=Pseudomonas sp. Irchel s3f19 TaxID=2009146 RepID=UPI0013590F48|nr:addiction module antidote protein [Pseudomonas sp. Irchel s3f19]
MDNTQIQKWDAAQLLDNDEKMIMHLEFSLEECDGDTSVVADALVTILRARSMNQLASETGISVKRLYKELNGEGPLTVATLIKVSMALGIQVSADSPIVKE